MPCSNHILVVPNSESTGKTYVIGDVHGEIEAFNEVLSELKPHDTLIVAGDLIDRGGVMDAEAGFVPASKQIMDTILRHANAPAGTMPKIYAIKGNHELDFLNILKAIDLLKIPEDKGFSHEEIKHITGARVSELQPGERDHTSRLVIVGHNIIDEPDSSSSTPALPVRSDTNHINLDGGAYFTKGFLRFNVTDDQIDIVGTNISEENQPLLHYGQTEIAAHIRTLAHREDRDEAEGEPGLKRIRL